MHMHGMVLPSRHKESTFSFFHPGWWVLHAVSIIVVLTIGYCLCED